MRSDTSKPMESGRIDRRMNMFVAGAIAIGDMSCQVRIRNIAEGGAMVQSSTALSAGSLFRLCRGTLTATGLVIWSVGLRSGLKFDYPLKPRDWMAPLANSTQVAVDAMICQVRAMAGSPQPQTLPAAMDPVAVRQSCLMQASELIREVGDILAADPAVLSVYSSELQNFDIALQLLKRAQAAA